MILLCISTCILWRSVCRDLVHEPLPMHVRDVPYMCSRPYFGDTGKCSTMFRRTLRYGGIQSGRQSDDIPAMLNMLEGFELHLTILDDVLRQCSKIFTGCRLCRRALKLDDSMIPEAWMSSSLCRPVAQESCLGA